MLKKSYPYYIGNKPIEANTDLPVTDKFTGDVATRVAAADEKAIDQAITLAVQAVEPMRRLTPFRRQEILSYCVMRFKERTEEFAEVLCVEAGKPIKDSKAEVGRLIDTFRVAAEETTRIHGEVLNLEISPRAEGYTGMWKRVPIGVCSFITPFNFPLNLPAHKIAPSLAVGCPFVLKPASRTPVSALLLGEILAETDLPLGAFSVLPVPRKGAALFSEDHRLKFLSFTGSAAVGWQLKARAGKKKVTLELGGNAGCIIEPDTDLEDAVQRVVAGAFQQSGQSCISVQRIVVHESIYETFRDRMVEAAGQLKSGDPQDPETYIGPMIAQTEVDRLAGWIDSAVARGAKLLCGGKREGRIMEPTLIENVDPNEELCAQEAFGPVAILSSYRDFDEALKMINASRFGLQAGVFTRDLYKAHKAWNELEVGGVVIGDSPSWRVEHMPYGGVKDSGLGREGIRYAMEEMTEMRLMVIRDRKL